MEDFLLIACIVVLVIYLIFMLDTIILVKKNSNKRLDSIKGNLEARINISVGMTILLGKLMIIRIIIVNK